MKHVAEFRSLLDNEGAGAIADKLFSVAKLGFQAEKQYQIETVEQKPLFGLIKRKPKERRQGLPAKPGASRIGGVPDVPSDFRWPQHKGKPLKFLIQLNCAEIAEFRDQTLLPADGILYFFYDLEAELHGEEMGRTPLVYYTKEISELQPATVPKTQNETEIILPAFPVDLIPIPTFPDGLSVEFDELKFSEKEAEGFFEAYAKWCSQCLGGQHREWGGLHKIGGHPDSVQGDIRAEFEMAANGHSGSTDEKLWAGANQNARNWRLLLQFDSDDDLDAMWGDAGMLYYCIREDDLKAARFEKVGVIGQCY